MYQLVNGSIFSSKCDLIVIPCNTNGGVTQSLAMDIAIRSIPHKKRKMAPGEVVYEEGVLGFGNALTVAYAASVDVESFRSSVESIERIVRSIAEYCTRGGSNISLVNIPLLGTGAGGLSAEESYQTIVREWGRYSPDWHGANIPSVGPSTVQLNIYAYGEDIYHKLLRGVVTAQPPVSLKNPRVFVSYTSTDPVNAQWVKQLATKLRKNGVDARLDAFHLKPGQDLPQWMTNEVILADKVLIVCDQHYAARADNRQGGVGWETMIIQGDMLSNLNTGKYVIIARNDDISTYLPVYVKSKYALHWNGDSIEEGDFRELLLHLFDCSTEPEVGEIPDFIKYAVIS